MLFSDIVLSRKKRSLIRDQLAVQLELMMLDGRLPAGSRLPSIRTLARILRVSLGTVSAAYRRLESLGHIKGKHGAGIFVDPANAIGAIQSPSLDAFVDLSLKEGVRRGHTGVEILDAVRRWASRPPPSLVTVFDPVIEMAALLAHELGEALAVPTRTLTPAQLENEAARHLDGELVVALPYQVKVLARHLPRECFEIVNVHLPVAVHEALRQLPRHSSLLVISSSRVVRQFARDVVRCLHGDELLAHFHPLVPESGWRPLLGLADLILVDSVAMRSVTGAGQRRIQELRIVTPESINRLRDLLSLPSSPVHARESGS